MGFRLHLQRICSQTERRRSRLHAGREPARFAAFAADLQQTAAANPLNPRFQAEMARPGSSKCLADIARSRALFPLTI